jgi:muramoyltetrapeptide carboxypeptidase
VPLVGFSDVTALHLLWESAGLVSLHGPVVTQLGRLDEASVAHARAVLFGEVGAGDTALPFGSSSRGAAARGALAGGNLALLAALCGTPWTPDLRGRVVVLEDIGEPAYRVDRMVWQLRHAAGLDEAAAVVVGDFTGVAPAEEGFIDALWADLAASLPCPLLRGAPVGHGARNWLFPLGELVEVDHAGRVVRLTRQPLEARS